MNKQVLVTFYLANSSTKQNKTKQNKTKQNKTKRRCICNNLVHFSFKKIDLITFYERKKQCLNLH